MIPKDFRIGWSKNNTSNVHQLKVPAINKPGYLKVTVYRGKERQENFFLAEPGDNVSINFLNDSLLTFDGKGVMKYQIHYELDQIRLRCKIQLNQRRLAWGKSIPGNISHWSGVQQYLSQPLDSMLDVKLSYLTSFNDRVGPAVYEVLRADIVGRDYFDRYYKFSGAYDYGLIVDSTKKQRYEQLYNSHFTGLRDFGFSDKAKFYISYLQDKMKLERKIWNRFPRDQMRTQSYILANFKGELRDKFLTNYLLMHYRPEQYNHSLFKASFSIVKTPYCLDVLNKLKISTALNAPAFPFELKDAKDQVFRLGDFRSKTIFLDFWYTGCAWCVRYYNDALRVAEEHFKNDPDVIFISVSIDRNKSMWMKSVESGKYTSEEIVNLYTDGQGSNHPLIRHYDIKGFPHQIIIDKHGRTKKIAGIQELEPIQLIRLMNGIAKGE